MDRLFVVGDIHGELERLQALLRKWNPECQQLVFLGDYVDRGKNSCGVIQLVHRLHISYGAVAIGGNHESRFLQWLDEPEDIHFSKWVEDESVLNDEEEVGMSESVAYYSNGGNKTIDSFYEYPCAYRYLPSFHANHIKEHFAEEISFLRTLPDYYEWNDYVCVHAGVNLAHSDWRKTTDHEFRWIRKPFHYMSNDTNKKFIFGHEPTKYLNHDKSNKVWVSPCKTKIGIDGCAVLRGLLHGLIVGGEQLLVHSVDANGFFSEQNITLS
ncbi:metallophosphoesterase [Paenibacillus polymyxa]|uniref:metallophosphoesterase n=1 Tax=Paenibacillus polymyxa TaxID=1406 RepID=UPI0001E6D6BC|nr:metallophosphoesterase [Paenibacillus polymyxa]WPQ59869.1 metallophosphoesterase [Paenibacillus polymyxa]